MNKVIKENGENTFVLMLTDIFNETSIVLVAGDFTEEIAAAFDKPLVDNSFEEPGLLSRKKQMIPKLNFAISNAKA